jgi:hypothetical protein
MEIWEYQCWLSPDETLECVRSYTRSKVAELQGGCSFKNECLDLTFTGKKGVSKVRFVKIHDGTKIVVTVADDVRDGTTKLFSGLVKAKKIKPFENRHKAELEHKPFKKAVEVLKEYLQKPEFTKCVEVLPAALEHAEECIYEHDGKLAKILDKLPNFVLKRAKAKTKFERLKNLADECSLGSVYRPTISETVILNLSEHYKFEYNGHLVLFDEHLTLGKGLPADCMSIHFIWDDKKSKIIIGYFGKHLPLSERK